MSAGLTQELANFVAGLRYDELPPAAVEAVRIGLLDCIGVMIAGAVHPGARRVAALVTTSADPDAAPALWDGRRLSPADAALVNGMAAHVLDFDDVAMSWHPSAVLGPVILALGHGRGASGAEAITAYAAGYEVWAELAAREPGQWHDRGFHPSAVTGTIAAAAAASRIGDLSATATAQALAIAASMAAGLTANFGTMTKPFQLARAAQSGVLAARLAADGFTGALDAIEHRNGFLAAFSPSGAPRTTGACGLGQDWRLAQKGVNIKAYPTCYATHRAIDGMIAVAMRHRIEGADVARIRVETGVTQARMLRNPRPRTTLEAKFSMEFAMAVALSEGRLGLGELDEAVVCRPDLQALLARVEVLTTEATMAGDPTFAPFDRVTVELTDGRRIEGDPITHARGSWTHRLHETELRAKFLACAAPVLGPARAETLHDQLAALPLLADLRNLDSILQEAA